MTIESVEKSNIDLNNIVDPEQNKSQLDDIDASKETKKPAVIGGPLSFKGVIEEKTPEKGGDVD
jgi:hypothetical protein